MRSSWSGAAPARSAPRAAARADRRAGTGSAESSGRSGQPSWPARRAPSGFQPPFDWIARHESQTRARADHGEAVSSVRFDEAELLAEASAEAGFADFGTGFRDGLRMLLRTYEENPFSERGRA